MQLSVAVSGFAAAATEIRLPLPSAETLLAEQLDREPSLTRTSVGVGSMEKYYSQAGRCPLRSGMGTQWMKSLTSDK